MKWLYLPLPAVQTATTNWLILLKHEYFDPRKLPAIRYFPLKVLNAFLLEGRMQRRYDIREEQEVFVLTFLIIPGQCKHWAIYSCQESDSCTDWSRYCCQLNPWVALCLMRYNNMVQTTLVDVTPPQGRMFTTWRKYVVVFPRNINYCTCIASTHKLHTTGKLVHVHVWYWSVVVGANQTTNNHLLGLVYCIKEANLCIGIEDWKIATTWGHIPTSITQSSSQMLPCWQIYTLTCITKFGHN